MEISTLAGLVTGIVFIVVGIFWGQGKLSAFVDASSVMITLGGSLSAMMVGYSVKDMGGFLKVIGVTFRKKRETDHEQVIKSLLDLAGVARKEGLLSLEETVRTLNDPFLRKGIQLIVDGTDPEVVREILGSEVESLYARHQKGVGMLESMGAYAPAFGMLGTLIGLINMLKNLSDPSLLGPGMATALITTFYGSLLANLVFLPMANKLKLRSAEEVFAMELTMEGMLSIQAGENPRLIEEKLHSFLPRAAVDTKAAGKSQA